MRDDADQLLLPGREMARRLNLSERTLYSLRQRGLPAIAVGAKILYQPADVLAWLTTNNTAPRPTGGDATK